MGWPTEMLLIMRSTNKLYAQFLRETCKKYQLTVMEANIISFLNNNPELDTAADIVELRMLPKSNVSQGVEGLIQKGLLSRRQDEEDRRKMHLSLTPKAEAVTEEIMQVFQKFRDMLFDGFSAEEMEAFELLNARMMNNTRKGLERNE